MRRDWTDDGTGQVDTDGASHARRRQFLAALGALGVSGLAGCGGDDGDTDTPTDTATPTDGDTPTATDTTAGTATDTTTATETTGTATATDTATATPTGELPEDPQPLLSFESAPSAAPGSTVTVTGSLENPYLFELQDGEVTVDAPEGWDVTATGGATFETLGRLGSQTATWEVTVPDDAGGTYDLTFTVSYAGPRGNQAEVPVPLSIVAFAAGDVPQEGLEAYYPLDSDTPVNQVTGTTAQVVGEPTTGASGVVGSAYEFTMDGSTADRAPGVADALVSGEDLPLNGEGATVGAWFRYVEHEPFSRVYQVGGGLGGGEGVGGIPGFETTFIGEDDDVRIYSTGGDTGAVITLTPDTWYFVVSVVDGDDARLHVFDSDGELDGSPATGNNGRSQSEAEPLLLMAGDQAETTGRTDEVRAYSRALSETEVVELYSGSGGST